MKIIRDKTGAELKTLAATLLLLPLLLIVVVANAWPLSSAVTPGDHTITLNHGGRERSAIVHVPRLAAERPALPVVLNFHGGGGHGANQKEYSLLDPLAESENFLAVYPNGTGRLSGRLLTWNAGTCCAYSMINKIDDVGFVRALIERLAEKLPIDRRRIYTTGMSNGGMMAHRLAVEASDIVAAVAPVAGGMVLPMVKSARPVPVLHIHSVDDLRALYAGGLGPPFPVTKNKVFHPNIDEMIKRWAERNGCAAEPMAADRRADSTSRGHGATKYIYPNCRDGAAVVLWKLTGAGHVWPGGKQKVLERILGPSTDIIDANREMWEFFSRYAL